MMKRNCYNIINRKEIAIFNHLQIIPSIHLTIQAQEKCCAAAVRVAQPASVATAAAAQCIRMWRRARLLPLLKGSHRLRCTPKEALALKEGMDASAGRTANAIPATVDDIVIILTVV